jgi:hypothetical protein
MCGIVSCGERSSARREGRALRTSPQSGRRARQQRPVRNHRGFQFSVISGKASLPKPLPGQIPIDGQALTAFRAFVLRRLSDAGPNTGSLARAGPASETLHDSGHSNAGGLTGQIDPNPTFMTAPPGERLRRKADDRIPCDCAAMRVRPSCAEHGLEVRIWHRVTNPGKAALLLHLAGAFHEGG